MAEEDCAYFDCLGEADANDGLCASHAELEALPGILQAKLTEMEQLAAGIKSQRDDANRDLTAANARVVELEAAAEKDTTQRGLLVTILGQVQRAREPGMTASRFASQLIPLLARSGWDMSNVEEIGTIDLEGKAP